MGLSQESQANLLHLASLKIHQIDESIAKGNIQNLLELQTELIQIADSIDDPEPRFLIFDTAINKYISGKCYEEAITLSTISLEKARKCFGEKHKEVATLLYLLALSHAHEGQIQNAISFGKQSVQMFEELDAVNEPIYLLSVMVLADFFDEIGLYPECIEMLQKSLSLTNSMSIPPERLAIVYRALADNYSSINNYPMAQEYTIKALELYADKHSLNYWSLKQNLAWLYSNNNRHNEAMLLIDEVCDTLRQRNESYVYAMALCDKASIYVHSQDSNRVIEAIRIADESAKFFENISDTLSNDYVHVLMTKASAYRFLDLFTPVQDIYNKVYSLQKQFLNINNIDDLESLAHSAVLATDFENGFSYFMELRKRILQDKGVRSMDYADIEFLISELCYLLHDYEKAILFAKDALPTWRYNLSKSLFLLDDKERAEFWNKYIGVFGESLPRMCYASANSQFSELMFDASLLSKGILLNTERLKRRLIQDEATIDEFLKPFFLNWQDIQNCLKDDEIAIEIVKVNPYKSIPVYVAVTIRRQYEMPKATTLFMEDELKQVPDTLYYQCKEMTDLMWAPLQSELQGIKNIYFSPAGALYNIGIEYLPGMEEYNIYRLSSTRELVTVPQTESENQAVLYGGLDYYAALGSSSVNRPSQPEDNILIEHANVRGMKLRGGKELLPQTKIEVEQISKELNIAQWKYELLTDREGTEESFKSYSGKRLRSLHLSTHGFYYTPDEAENVDYDFLRLDNHVASAEDKALTRSGLILSGANHILEGEELPANVEDGILTAKEIADVDLRGLDLVVLSACQTGLGDISQGEGVFGLQRGFKKAGANSILMSLWEVDDKATQILMTQFYRSLLSGQSKHHSLLSAQKYLREADNGRYNDPKYWAAFILLDSTD